jgi:hypothetical protein
LTEGKTGELGTGALSKCFCQEKAETSMGGVGLEEREAEVPSGSGYPGFVSEIGGVYPPKKCHIDKENMGK